MGIKRNRKQLVAAAIAIAGLAGGAVAAQATNFADSLGVLTPPAVWPSITPTCTGNPCSINLAVGTGTVTVADVVNGPTAVPFLGFGVNGADPALAGSPNSTIKVPVGTTLNITVTHPFGADFGLSFPSLPVGSVTGGGTSYTVSANTVGTSVFQPGSNLSAPRQIASGLVGVLIVTPAGCTDTNLMCAYDTSSYQDEALVATTDLDLEFACSSDSIVGALCTPAQAAEFNTPFDMGYFGQPIDPDFSQRQVYHVINGKSFPDTDVIAVQGTDNVLLRYVNAGVSDKSMGLLGIRQSVLARNTSRYSSPQTFIAPLVGPGETADVAVVIPPVLARQYYSLMDQGHQMNNGTGTGFGGALVFLEAWPYAAPLLPIENVPPTPPVVPAGPEGADGANGASSPTPPGGATDGGAGAGQEGHDAPPQSPPSGDPATPPPPGEGVTGP